MLDILVQLRWFATAGVVLAAALWLIQARRRPSAPLAVSQRLTLVLFVLAALVTRGLIGENFDRANLRTPPATLRLPSSVAARIGLEVPLTTWATLPEINWLDRRPVLMLPPPAQVEWRIDDQANAASFDFGFDPGAYRAGQTNGADFSLAVVGPASTREIFFRRLDPAQRPTDRGRQHEEVILPPFEPGAKLVFRTGPGEYGNAGWDWVYLGQLRFRHSAALARRQFPGFNRPPDRVEGNNSALLPGDDGKPYLLLSTRSVLRFRLNGGEHTLELDYGFAPSAYSNGGRTNGAIFRVEHQSADGRVITLFEHYPKPVSQLADRELQHARLTLPPVRPGEELILSILPGDHGDASWDHTFVSRLALE